MSLLCQDSAADPRIRCAIVANQPKDNSMQPKWIEKACTDTYRLLIDETGVYDPEIEIADGIGDSDRYQLYRVPLERHKTVIVDDTRYLVPVAYETSWPHYVGSYQPWFHDSLDSIADSAGTDRETLIAQLCSDDPVERMQAYMDIAGCHGWHEFDQYPIELTQEELDLRWDRDEPEPGAPFKLLLPNHGFNPGGGPVYVEKGDLILYREHLQDGSHRLCWARVLDRVLREHDGKRLPGKWVRVLTLSDIATFGYIRWVSIEHIDHCRKDASDFLRWFFSDGPSRIEPDTIAAMADYGSLSEGYLSAALDRLEKTGDFRK